MRSQLVTLAALSAAAFSRLAVDPTISTASKLAGDPDLTLREVAFARLSEGRVVARGTAGQLDYRRAGGRLIASDVDATMRPEPGAGSAFFGSLPAGGPPLRGERGRPPGRAS